MELKNKIYNEDCITFMHQMHPNSVDFTLTDIPYTNVSRPNGGIRNFDYGNSDIATFNTQEFCELVYKVTRENIVIFTGATLFSEIYSWFIQQKGTVRTIVWEKTNPAPVNGQYVYLSGVELGVWFKKKGSKTFNPHCKNTVFRFPNGNRKFNPTGKNLKLFIDLVEDNTKEGDLVFDPCIGGGTSAVAAIATKRNYCGLELDSEFYSSCIDRVNRALKGDIK